MLLIFASVATAVAADVPNEAEASTSGMAYIPTGSFGFGNPDDPNSHPRPTHLDGYWIDRYPYPNRAGERPKVYVTWGEAEALCATGGKRLCSAAEWEKACKGPHQAHFIYGNRPLPGKCHLEAPVHPASKRIAIGEKTACCNDYGACEMGSNINEWVRDVGRPFGGAPDPTTRMLRGADWGMEVSRGRCSTYDHAHPPDTQIFHDDGFRCCADFAAPD